MLVIRAGSEVWGLGWSCPALTCRCVLVGIVLSAASAMSLHVCVYVRERNHKTRAALGTGRSLGFLSCQDTGGALGEAHISASEPCPAPLPGYSGNT